MDSTGAVTLTKRTWTQTIDGTDLAQNYTDNTVGCTIWDDVLEYDSIDSNGSSDWYGDKVALGDVLPTLNSAFGKAIVGFSGTSYSVTTRKNLYVNVPSDSPTDYDGARAWLNASPLTVIYKLAEPIEMQLPSVTLPSWPDGEANLWASAPVPTEMRVDYPGIDHLTVQRVNPDGSLWTVGDGLADGETVVDPLPPLNTPTDYVITAHTAAGATSELRITETLLALVGAFNFGAAAGACELARLNPDWKHDVARSGTLYHFADGGEGGGLPVAYGGQDVDATRSMGFTLLDLDQLRRLQELAREHFVCWYRDPYGGRALCSVSWSFSSGVPYDRLDVSASMTETVFEEAW